MNRHKRNGKWVHSWGRIVLPDGATLQTLMACRACGLGPVFYREVDRGGLGECLPKQEAGC